MTNDFIDDACESLDQSGQPYIVLVGDGPLTRVVSNLGGENIEMMRGWLDEGHIDRIFREHFDNLNL